MVFKIAGWILFFEQVRTWLDRQGRKHDHLEDSNLMIDLNRWFEERGIYYLWAVCTNYPRGEAVVVLEGRSQVDRILLLSRQRHK